MPVTGQVRRLEGDLPANDRKSCVAEYLDTVREIERRIQLAEKQNSNSSLAVPASPSGIPDDHQTHTNLMFDLMALAFQADITRVSTFMMAREVSYRTFPMLGISEGFHPASHHQNNKERLENLTKINTYHVSLVAHLLERLKATPDGDGSLLDHSLILYGSGMSNSNVHNHSPPACVAGGRRPASRPHEGRATPEESRRDAYGESSPVGSGQSRLPAGKHRRQHRPALGSLAIMTTNTWSAAIVLVAGLGFAQAAFAAGSEVADAAQNRDMDTLRTLLVKQHANVNTPQPDGATAPFLWAAHWNDLDAVKLLLGAGADAKAANRYGATPLSEGVVLGSAAMVEALLSAGADP